MSTVGQIATLYHALKLHFTTNYDYFKYNGKIKTKIIPQEQYYAFEKIYKKHKNDILTFYLANFLENPNVWIHELLNEESFENYISYKRKKQSLTNSFRNDIINLLCEYGNLNKIIEVKTDFPILMKKVLHRKIHLETLIILNMICNFFPFWDKKMEDNILWNELKLKCLKYSGFLNVDLEKMKKIVKEQIKEG